MPSIVFGGRIRSVHPDSLPPLVETPTTEVAAESGPSHPAARARRQRDVPVMREEVMGLRFSQFPGLPAAVWNHVTSAYRDSLKQLFVSLSGAYTAGIDGHLEDALSKTIPAHVHELGRECVQGVLVQERGFLGTRIPCHLCDQEAIYHEDVAKSLVTGLGIVPTRRSYYVCPGGHTFYPQDILLGVDGEHRILPAVQENLALLTAHMAYAKAVEILERLLHIDLSAETAERVTATVSGKIEERQEMERKQAFSAQQPTFPEPVVPVSSKEVGIVAADGGFVRIRNQETQSEFKAGVLGTLTPVPGVPLVDPETGKVRSLPPTQEKFYLAHLENIDDFFDHLTVEFYRRGLDRCSVVQFLADGAECYWNRFSDLVQPGQTVVYTLDFYHGMDYVRDAAEAIFGKSRVTAAEKVPQVAESSGNSKTHAPGGARQESPNTGTDTARAKERQPHAEQMTRPKEGTLSRAWYDKMGGHLLEGRIDVFFNQLKQQLSGREQDKDDPVFIAFRYFEARRHLLTYKECIERGLPIGSGMAEGGIRFVGKDRLDRPGSKWSKPGAEAILQLRTLDASKRWSAFFAQAAEERQARYQHMKQTWLQAA